MKKGRVAMALLVVVAGAGAGGYFARPAIDQAIGRRGEREARIVSEHRDGERLLLTLRSGDETMLATFRQRADDIETLVNPGDTITLRVSGRGVFADDAPILGVSRPGARRTSTDDDEATVEAADGADGEGAEEHAEHEPSAGDHGEHPDGEAHEPEPAEHADAEHATGPSGSAPG